MLMRSAAVSQTTSEARKRGVLAGVCDCHVVQPGLAVAEVAQRQGFTFHRGLFCCLTPSLPSNRDSLFTGDCFVA